MQAIKPTVNLDSLRITEIFLSLQGETKTVGLPTTFIRLTGCPLRCQYCDSAYAFKGGKLWSRADILEQVKSYYAQHVTVTGGEPLSQPGCIALLTELCDLGYQVSLETSGALDVSQVDPRVMKVVDLKTPGSLECHRNLYSNIEHITPHDQIKFVICDRNDFEWSQNIVSEYKLTEKCEVLFSPSFGQITNRELADWVIAARLPVRFQLQLHKYVWGDEPGR
jgi:7-carboxy-7-deazaguanine synthase